MAGAVTAGDQVGLGVMDARGLAAIAAFVARLEEPAGTWRGGEPIGDGLSSMPWFESSPLLEDFRRAAYEHGLVVSFDWPAWIADGGARLVSGPPQAFAALDLADVQRVATAIIRAERFSEGALADAFEDGRMPALIRRVAELAARAG